MSFGGKGPTSSSPNLPNDPKFNTDPNKYQGFDTSALSQGAIANGNQAGANQIAQSKAQSAGMGGGRSSAQMNNVGQIQAGLGQNAQNIYNQNAQLGFGQKLSQMQNENAFNLGQYGTQASLYGTEGNLAQNAYNNNGAPMKNYMDAGMGAAKLAMMLTPAGRAAALLQDGESAQ